MFRTRTLFERDKYRVVKAHSHDAPIFSALIKSDWSERVAISARRHNVNPTQIAEELRRGGGLVLMRHNVPVAALAYVPRRDGSWELRRLGVRRSFSGRGFTTFLLSTLEDLARESGVHSIRVPVDAHSPQHQDYFSRLGFSVDSDRTLSTVFASAMQPVLMRKFIL
ncbi:MAG: GNAT family N-acetyltransferase [Casimicrobiaceae bacterium]|nr:GNAT family N-acetyltransferase [Casimicrobiaceae bacterium]